MADLAWLLLAASFLGARGHRRLCGWTGGRMAGFGTRVDGNPTEAFELDLAHT